MRRLIPFLLIAALLLGGCSSARQSDPYQVDTVIRIPVDPTDEPTEPEEITEAPTEAPTEPEETTAKKTNSSSKGSGSGSKKSSSNKKETEPPEVTLPLVIHTDPPAEEITEPSYDPADYEITSLAYAILDELNAGRTTEGVYELAIDHTLSGIAYLRAMEGSVSWSHTRPDGRDYTSVLDDYGYGYGDVAELMVYASGNGNAASMTGKWMSSTTHRNIILSDAYYEIGIGVYREDGVTYVVCLLVG